MESKNPDKVSGYVTRRFSVATKRYCRMLDLKNDPDLISKYRYWHSAEHHWKEIRDGLRQVGILEMEIYMLENHLFMVVDTPLDFDWEKGMAKLARLPRQAEWEEFVATFQKCAPTDSADEKWKMTERIFYLY